MDDQEKQPYNIDLQYHDKFDMEGQKYIEHVVTYEDIIGYQVSATVVAVMTKDGATLVIPIDQLKFIRHYPV